ncbi:cysteine-rich repeat secretory protein 38-like [Helianthus annuus]|uniref:cysteine-rich repeat secretory protein 38-like n=1 Tax=Helianthus annuus TaxID=4232 RepID=UPI000B8FF832|nr:cysteine-rich repeat secretory protein 38-like [Helianthus annuus]
MMEELASTVPDHPLMYQAAEIDVGVNGKRYGLAQCGRDLSKVSCQNCLEDRLATCISYVQNRTGWEIVGFGCSMWYFSNISEDLTPSNYSELPPNAISGAQRCHGGIGLTTIIISMTISTAFTQYF